MNFIVAIYLAKIGNLDSLKKIAPRLRERIWRRVEHVYLLLHPALFWGEETLHDGVDLLDGGGHVRQHRIVRLGVAQPRQRPPHVPQGRPVEDGEGVGVPRKRWRLLESVLIPSCTSAFTCC